MPDADYFLKERWQEKARAEKGETKRWKYEISDFEEMIEKAKVDKKAKEELYLILDWLKNSCRNYVNVCKRWVAAKRDLEEGEGSKDMVEIAEDARSRCHKVVFDNLNILARAFNKYNLDNQWRDYFGTHYKFPIIESWAYEMGEQLLKNEEKINSFFDNNRAKKKNEINN